MKTTQYLVAVCLIALCGCSSGTMSVDSYDGRTGASSHKLYSKYYDAGTWLIPKHLGISVVVDHEKTYVPIVSGVQQSLGLLGPDDLVANGKVTIYLWSFDPQPHSVKIVRLTSHAQPAAASEQTIVALPKQKTGAVVGNLQISNYGTEIPIKLEYELAGKRASIELKLKRRTYEELNKYFKSGGDKPPYPWYHVSGT